jgi:hypothetical protein
MALRILRSEAVKKSPLFEQSEFGDFQLNEVKFSQLDHSLDFLVLL